MLKAITLLGNIALLGRALLTGVWVLFGLHQEVLTGQSLEQPFHAKVVAATLIALSAVLAATLLPVWRRAGRRWLVAACCLALLSVLEIVESILIYTHVGHYGLHEYSYYAYGPLAAIWAILNLCIFRREARPAS